jgi:hypothetical protein
MRCTCCDRILSDYESTIRSEVTGEFLDTCMTCLKEIGIKFKDRKDLRPTEELNPEDTEHEE